MKWTLSLLLAGISWLSSSCQAAATPEPAHPTTSQAATPSPLPMTATPRPTGTVLPTEIPETLTQTPDIAATVIGTSPPRLHSSFPSPDGEWRAEIVIHDCVKLQGNIDSNAVEILNLIRVRDQTEVMVESMLLTCGGVGAYGPGGLFWSPNNRFFYYTDARESAPDGLCGYWARPVKRVDVNSQNAETVGGAHLSPDKTKLAFWRDTEIVIWSLDEGEIARVPASTSGAFPNEIAWAPNSQSIIYLQTESDCYPFGKSYITRLDLPAMTQELLFESEEPSFTWLTWDAPYRISLADEKGNRWRYHLVDRELTAAP